MGKSQIQILLKNLKSFILKSQFSAIFTGVVVVTDKTS